MGWRSSLLSHPPYYGIRLSRLLLSSVDSNWRGVKDAFPPLRRTLLVQDPICL